MLRIICFIFVSIVGMQIKGVDGVFIAKPVDGGAAKNLIVPNDSYSLYLKELNSQLKANTVENARKGIAYIKALLKNKKGKKKFKTPIRRKDLWLYNPEPEDSFIYTSEIKRVRKTPPPSAERHKWLALSPGDVIYYRGSFGVKNAAHIGTYIGNGYTFEKWYEGGSLLKGAKGVIVISKMENFSASSERVASFSAKKCLASDISCKERCLKSEPNRYRQVYFVQKNGKNLKRTPEELIEALANMTHGEIAYHPLYDNCIGSADAVVNKSQTKLSSILQTLHFTCQKPKNKELKSCIKPANKFMSWGAKATNLALALMVEVLKPFQLPK